MVKASFCQERLPRFLKKSLFAAQKLFWTILELGFTTNPKLALQAQTVGFAAKIHGQKAFEESLRRGSAITEYRMAKAAETFGEIGVDNFLPSDILACLRRLARIRVNWWRGGYDEMADVRIRENESFENALRRFKKQCEKAGILSEVRRREHYEKPSVKRKRKALAARKRALKRLRKMADRG